MMGLRLVKLYGGCWAYSAVTQVLNTFMRTSTGTGFLEWPAAFTVCDICISAMSSLYLAFVVQDDDMFDMFWPRADNMGQRMS